MNQFFLCVVLSLCKLLFCNASNVSGHMTTKINPQEGRFSRNDIFSNSSDYTVNLYERVPVERRKLWQGAALVSYKYNKRLKLYNAGTDPFLNRYILFYSCISNETNQSEEKNKKEPKNQFKGKVCNKL